MAKAYIRQKMMDLLDKTSSSKKDNTLSPVESVGSEKDKLLVKKDFSIVHMSFLTADSFELRSLSPYFWYDLEILFRTASFWQKPKDSNRSELSEKGNTFRTVIWTRIVEDSYDSITRISWQDKNTRILNSLIQSSKILFKLRNKEEEEI